MKTSPIGNLSLAGFQDLNSRIYLVQNDRNYEAREMMSRLNRYSTHVLKAVRKEKYNTIPRDLCMGFSWAMALANRFHIHLENETWNRFPGVCPYCGGKPCFGPMCKQKSLERQEVTTIGKVQPATLRDFQKMFASIYPENTLKDSATHLAEECGELSEAIEEYMGTHQQKLFVKIEEELVDVITNQLSVASCLSNSFCIGLDFALDMEKIFQNGCPGCTEIPCKCGFVVHNAHANSVTLEK